VTSIRQRLLVWLGIGLSLATAAGAWAVFMRARAEARELFDTQMKLMVAAFPDEGFGRSQPRAGNDAIPGDVVVVQIWDRNGTRLYLSRPGRAAPQRSEIGFSTVRTRDGDWRVYTALVGDNVVQVSQPTSIREELAAGIALRTMVPLLVLLPLLLVLIWITIGRGLKPIDDVAAAVARRSAGALDPLPVDRLPREIRPLVTALNALLARLGQSLGRERAFIADAAHELRTPLTALHLQIQLAERAASDAERAKALARLRGGAERATRLVEQLLTLARSEPDAAERPFVPLDLSALARDVVAEQAPIAEARHRDLGFSGDGPVSVNGDPDALRMLLGNLVDNAIRYTDDGGAIDVATRIMDGAPELVVADDGPGIPPAERERVFDRFYRGTTNETTGSGLGLAIVREVATRHGATIDVGGGLVGRGTSFRLRFPPAR
jgi:two-component system OmpR family sensor kinase